MVTGMNGVGGKARAWGWKAVGMGGQGIRDFEGKEGNSQMAGEVKCVVRGSGGVHQENSKCRPLEDSL